MWCSACYRTPPGLSRGRRRAHPALVDDLRNSISWFSPPGYRIPTRELSTSLGAFRNPVFPAEWSSQLRVNSNKNGIEREQFTQMKLLLKPTPSFLLVCLTSSDKNNILYTKFRIHYTRAKVKSSRKIARGVALVIYQDEPLVGLGASLCIYLHSYKKNGAAMK